VLWVWSGIGRNRVAFGCGLCSLAVKRFKAVWLSVRCVRIIRVVG